ncbi:solute carrier family 22 member 6-B-like isoform X1 [Eublepharis macularius]|uniref:Solute carrier family 22 member 6-B-like isoform X1 n=1 Tax=Eublepharis macularius TaxID=481883 RepID=A0AA97KEF4_EUBMA|nr:solute carrier family 22 member 6-B-like isoform X1 [Eublepharis macularius]
MMTPAGGKSRRPSLAPGIPTTPTISFGDLLEEVGSMGPFQIFSVLLLSLPVLLLASHNLVQNFSAASPEHKCRLSPFNNASDGHPMPLDHSQLPDRCRRFVHQMARDSNSSLDKDRGAETEPCHDGWLYDNSTFSSTLVTEWDLVCNLQPLKNLAQSLFMAGVLVGAFIFGDLSDRFGRRLILIWSLLLVAVMGSGAALSAGFATYCVFRFLSGVGISGFLLNYICLSLEWVPTRYRATVIATQSYCSTAGQVLLAGLAYGIRNWRWLQLAISAPFFCFFAYSWWLPESARWLLANNKHEAALRNLKHVARINGKAATGETVFLEMLETQVGSNTPGKGAHSCLDLFRTPALRRISCCLMFISFSMNMTYFGLSMDLSVFGLNVFLMQLFFGAVDLLAKMGCALMLSFFGRRTIQAASLVLAGAFLLLTLPVPPEMVLVRMAFVVLGKGCLAASSMCLYLYGGELFPTVIRQTGTSFITAMARLGGIVAPLVLMSGGYQPFLPLVIFGIVPIISGISAGFLPEMLKVPLMDTIEQIEERASWKSKAISEEKPQKIMGHVIQSTRF